MKTVAVKKTTEEIIDRMVNNKRLAQSMYGLRQRWEDEKEYEDWAEYEKVLKGWAEAWGCEFVKGTKRPFGMKVKHNEAQLHYKLKLAAKSFSVEIVY